ncbi:MAG: FAD-binding oxidoreductase [Lentimicrobium sp.]|jgi:glycine/D-amino acid oxidase-like deaminating enzyme|nr:FAD-binding oxidoreductase [Lentimicrobium sp.]MDD2526659.1 FAD-dependent oxidoreductase [Lentimicrobiaceae bacterium]MDD4596843.1 FAD-dependent oxidoreductase [Lentimicrobiaceae bacterium]MDY0025298.1 FAD-dependent oxidoreductase [Lentimicrobium sp.]
MKLRSNHPFWLVKNALLESYPSADKSFSTEILIVGAGITGALIAYELLNSGYKEVVLIDKRDVANGSTAASTAMLQYEIDIPLYQLIEKRGLTTAVTSYKECEKAITTLKSITRKIKSTTPFQKKRSIYFSTSRKGLRLLQKEFQARIDHGFNVRWVNDDELKSWGLIALGAIESASGGVIDTYGIALNLIKYNSDKGLKVLDRTEITNLKHTDDGITAETSRGINIQCKQVINCTGYESTAWLKEDIVKLKNTFAIASEAFNALPEAFKDKIYWDNSSPYFYFRGTEDNRIVMGGGDVNFKNTAARDALIDKKEKMLVKKFHQLFPDIQFKSDYAWAGTFGETADGLPYMGRPDPLKNEHYVLGFGGNGITFSVMGMQAIVPSLLNEPHPFLEYYKFNR